MKRRLCLSALALGLFAVVTAPAQAQILSIGPGGVQYNGFGVGYYGQQYGPITRVRTYPVYGNGMYGYQAANGYQWGDGYRPFGWRGGTLAYGSGYLGYANPYYNNSFGSYGDYNYSQPLPLSSRKPTVTSDNPGCEASLEGAIAAFEQKDYDSALDIMNKGLVQCPHDSAMHEFRALILFAKGDYQQAAATIHSVLAAGPGWNWATLSSVYPSVAVYTRQLRALEAFTKDHPQDGAARFLQAYHYMVEGYPESAAKELEMVVRLEPNDRVAVEVLKMVSKPVVVNSTIPAPQPTAQPAIEQVKLTPATKPIDQATLVGTWLAARDDGSKFELALKEDRTFNWKFTQQETVQSFGGTYQLDGNVVTLLRQAGGSLVAVVTPQGSQKFNFKLQGAPAEDPGLNFSK